MSDRDLLLKAHRLAVGERDHLRARSKEELLQDAMASFEVPAVVTNEVGSWIDAMRFDPDSKVPPPLILGQGVRVRVERSLR